MRCEKCKYRTHEIIKADITVHMCHCTHPNFMDANYGERGRPLPICNGEAPVFCPLRKKRKKKNDDRKQRTSTSKKRRKA